MKKQYGETATEVYGFQPLSFGQQKSAVNDNNTFVSIDRVRSEIRIASRPQIKPQLGTV